MGVPRFFYWICKKFPYVNKEYKNNKNDKKIDNLCIDMNGTFHPVSQRVYKENPIISKENNKKCYKEIWKEIINIVDFIKPTKRIILCVDGIAPRSKMIQQRQRRYKNGGVSTNEGKFNSTHITPGTEWMYGLCKFINNEIKKYIVGKNINIIFSNERCPGEGEHKIINYMRMYRNKRESWCVHGLDADLVMLLLATHIPNVYIMRDQTRGEIFTRSLVNVYTLRKELLSELNGNLREMMSEHNCRLITDFIFICFLIGNDFLPHIPSLEIIEGGMETLIYTYNHHVKRNGYILQKHPSHKLNKRSFFYFISELSRGEYRSIVSKGFNSRYQSDPVFTNNTFEKNGRRHLNFKKYRMDYYKKKFSSNINKIVDDYINGLDWIIKYYTEGLSCWNWYYPHFHAPLLSDISDNLRNYKEKKWAESKSVSPYVQLLTVLPPQKSYLLPNQFRKMFENKERYPEEYKIDYTGTFREWEGIVKLPFIDIKIVGEECNRIMENVKDSVILERCKIDRTRDYIFKNDRVLNCKIDI